MTTAIVAVVVLVLAILFRTEIKKLVSWIVSFKRIARTPEGGYALEPGTVPDTAEDALRIGKAPDNEAQVQEDSDFATTHRWFFLLHDKKYREAVELLDSRITATSDPVEHVKMCSYKGHVLFEEDSAQGVRYFEELIREQPTSSEPYYWYGLSYMFSSLPQDAIPVFDRGLAAVPDSLDLIGAKAECLIRIGKTGDARTLLTGALSAKTTKKPILYRKLAELLEREEDPDEQERVLLEGIGMNPRDEALRERHAKFLLDASPVVSD